MILIGLKDYRDDPSLPARSVGWWTSSTFVHVEVFFQEGGTWRAIAARTSDNRVSCVPASEVIRNPLWWEFYVVPIPNETEALAWLHRQCGQEFGWLNLIAAQVLTLGMYNPAEWFCSELAYVFLRQNSSLHLPGIAASGVSPARLRAVLHQARVPALPVLPD